ncbi:hypothetical protein VFA_002137 [Vibrio furnissii CIP 102972]|nr:hypothetical protein VFA_002137 [Vibrio furnissii CIP 102972]
MQQRGARLNQAAHHLIIKGWFFYANITEKIHKKSDLTVASL